MIFDVDIQLVRKISSVCACWYQIIENLNHLHLRKTNLSSLKGKFSRFVNVLYLIIAFALSYFCFCNFISYCFFSSDDSEDELLTSVLFSSSISILVCSSLIWSLLSESPVSDNEDTIIGSSAVPSSSISNACNEDPS